MKLILFFQTSVIVPNFFAGLLVCENFDASSLVEPLAKEHLKNYQAEGKNFENRKGSRTRKKYLVADKKLYFVLVSTLVQPFCTLVVISIGSPKPHR